MSHDLCNCTLSEEKHNVQMFSQKHKQGKRKIIKKQATEAH